MTAAPATAVTPAAAPPRAVEPEKPPVQTESKWRKYGIPVVVLLLAAAVVVTITRNWNAWEGGRIEQTTDDAYVRADTVGIAPHISGPIIELPIRDNQHVKKGDPLFTVDPRPYQAELDSAIASVDPTNLQIGAIARKGNVICQAVNELGFTTQEDFVRKTVSNTVSLLATDEHAGYRHLGAHGFVHKTVNHSAKQYVVGSVHTNTIESFWSLIKRGIIGNYHHVSREYLPLYLNEFSFRFNNRKNPDIFDAIIAGC